MTPFTIVRFLLTTALLPVSLAASAQAPASTARPASAHRTPVATRTAASACSKLPEISPKVPAVPAGSPCAKPLYTIVSIPSVKLDYVSPMEGPALRDTLGLESSSFSLDYIDTKIGTGALAQPHKWYSIHYTGYLLDGTKFDSSVDRGDPIVIPYGQHQVIPGWDTGFDGMRIGGKRRLFIPFQLAYGATAHGPIPARSELIFDVEFIAQSDEKPAPKTPPTPPTPAASPATTPAPAPGTPGQPIQTQPAKPAAPTSTPPADANKPGVPPPAQSTTPDTTTKPKQ